MGVERGGLANGPPAHERITSLSLLLIYPRKYKHKAPLRCTGLIFSVRDDFGFDIVDGSEGCSPDTVSGWAEVPEGAELVAVRSTSGNGVIHSLAFVWAGTPQPGKCDPAANLLLHVGPGQALRAGMFSAQWFHLKFVLVLAACRRFAR